MLRIKLIENLTTSDSKEKARMIQDLMNLIRKQTIMKC